MMHLPFLFERPDMFSVEALSDVDGKALELVGRRYHVGRLHADYRKLLEEPIDAVLIVSGGSHSRPVSDAARAGKHIFVEKPLGENLGEVEAAAQAVRAARVTLMVGYHKRYDPGYCYAREQIRGLNDLRMVRVDVLHPVDAWARRHYHIEPVPGPEQAGRADSEATDGLAAFVNSGPPRRGIDAVIGADAPEEQRVAAFLLFNSLIHDINAVRGILGEPEEVLFSEFWKGGRCMHAVLRWKRDVRCAFSWIFLAGVRNYREELLFLSPEGRVTITFPAPYFRHFPTPVTVEAMEKGRVVERKVTVSMDEAFRLELHHFHECVTTGRQPDTGLEDALADTRLIERIARAYKPAI